MSKKIVSVTESQMLASSKTTLAVVIYQLQKVNFGAKTELPLQI